MKKKKVIPTGALIPDSTNYRHATNDSYDSYMAAPEIKVIDDEWLKDNIIGTDPLKERKEKKIELTLKELKEKCKLRDLPQSGTKKVLSQRLKDDDERIRDEKIFAAQEENRIVREHKDKDIIIKQRQLKVLRKQIQQAYNDLAKHQTECNRLDELANKIRTSIEILKE